jgi:hypothetical protein
MSVDRGEMNKALINALDVDSLISELELLSREPSNYTEIETVSLTQRALMALEHLSRHYEVRS